MKKFTFSAMILAFCCGMISSAFSQPAPQPETTCFESRKGASEVVKRDLQPGWPNVKCSPMTGAVLWWGDPFDGTVPMGDTPLLERVPAGKAVVKPRSEKLAILPMCGTACHNGVGPAFIPPKLPTTKKPIPIPTMEGLLPDAKNLQHGRGSIWCLDCHHTTQRAKLVDNFGDPVSIDQPQLLCGKCHGDKMRDCWFTCTECHNPHNVQDGVRNRGFIQIAPESPPQLPKGMKDAKHELLHGVAH
jgi:hypothetical protein